MIIGSVCIRCWHIPKAAPLVQRTLSVLEQQVEARSEALQQYDTQIPIYTRVH
jgi:hypothetical protein